MLIRRGENSLASMSRPEALERLLRGYERSYNIYLVSDENKQGMESFKGLKGRLEFFEENEKYVVSRKANLWTANGEEFLYIFDFSHMSLNTYEECMAFVLEDGEKRLHIGPGHMYSYLTAVILCDDCDEDALQTLKKSHKRKDYRFSLHGWMEYHAIVIETGAGSLQEIKIASNQAATQAEKALRPIFKKRISK